MAHAAHCAADFMLATERRANTPTQVRPLNVNHREGSEKVKLEL